MFTGLIEAVGQVLDVTGAASATRVRIRTELAATLRPGDSLAVNGVCLTVVAADADRMEADIGPETARVTTLGALRRDDPVNLERSMRADSRFGGHFVQGHVDGVGTVARIRAEGDAFWLRIAFDRTLAPYLILRGAIAVNGISLTVAGLGDGEFDVMIIPFTWQHTNLHTLSGGDRVNLEFDMVGKYVARSAELARGGELKPVVK
jgi:riboflavin synthase